MRYLILALSIYVVNIVNCEKVVIKKDADAASSIRTYSSAFAPPDFSKFGNANFEKTISFLKSLEDQSITSNPLLNQHFVGKSIVQFWPPDMDKKKFFNSMLGPAWSDEIKYKKEPTIFSDIRYTPTQQTEEQPDLPPIASLPEKLPDIPNFEEYEIYEKTIDVPQYQQPKKARKPIKEHKIELMKVQQEPITIENYQNYNHNPTQAIIVATENYYSGEDYAAITNPGPVRFLQSSQPIHAVAHHDYKFPSRGTNNLVVGSGNKKRKLKKKVKTAQQNHVQQHFTETTASYNLPHGEQSTVGEIAPESVHVQIIDGNGFDTTATPPVEQFANVIDNVSNLTELSFRKNYNSDEENKSSPSSSSSSGERTRQPDVVVVESYESKKKPELDNISSTRQKYRGMSVNELKPWDFMYVQLSRAIEDRDLVKIKSLVNAIGEKEKSRKLKKVGRGRVTTTTTESPIEEETTSFRSRLRSTTAEIPETTVDVTEPITTNVIETTTARRRYLAPRIRLSLEKALKEKELALSRDNDESITTEAYTIKPSTLALTLKRVTTSEGPDEPTTELEDATTVTESAAPSTEKYVRPQRVRATTEKLPIIPTSSTSKKTTRHLRRGRIVTPRNRKPTTTTTTTALPPSSTTVNPLASAIRPIRNSSRVRRIKGFRRMAGLNRY